MPSSLASLPEKLAQHGVSLALAEGGKLLASADQPMPTDLLVEIQAYRAVLLLRLSRGQLPDGRLDPGLHVAAGRCASCAQWTGPDLYGDGLCAAGKCAHGWPEGNPEAPVITSALHACAAHGGRGWRAK